MVAFAKPHRKTHTPDRSAKDSGLRYYSPEISRWLSRDPVGTRGGLNLYVFVANTPVSQMDPFGLFGWYCSPGLQTNDTGWVYVAPIPGSEYEGTSGSQSVGQSDSAVLIYRREKSYKYLCSSSIVVCEIKSSTDVYAYFVEFTPTAQQGSLLWQGTPGAWPPIPGLPGGTTLLQAVGQVIVQIIAGELTLVQPALYSGQMLSQAADGIMKPPPSESGTLVEEGEIE